MVTDISSLTSGPASGGSSPRSNFCACRSFFCPITGPRRRTQVASWFVCVWYSARRHSMGFFILECSPGQPLLRKRTKTTHGKCLPRASFIPSYSFLHRKLPSLHAYTKQRQHGGVEVCRLVAGRSTASGWRLAGNGASHGQRPSLLRRGRRRPQAAHAFLHWTVSRDTWWGYAWLVSS
jgi:hypothetical protein